MIPPQIGDDYQMRVYDTRLDSRWLASLIPELGIGATTENTCIIGGDFMQAPRVEDSVAMQQGCLQRWSPAGQGLSHLFVVPRPHQATWVQRAQLQLGVEENGVWISVALVVPRGECPQSLTEVAVRRLIPSIGPLLDSTSVEVKVAAVGERPALVRVPAGERTLPPKQWEAAHLPRNRVLLIVSMRRHVDVAPAFVGRWIRGDLPQFPPSPLELLRLEFPLAPATKVQAAEKALGAALRKAIQLNGLVEPPTLQLRQVQVAHGAVYGILAVPRAQARAWLRASGCGGLYMRPFWTPDTGDAVKRSQFTLLWVRGRSADGPRMWEVLREQSGFFGLVYEGKDLAVRVSAEADVSSLQAQLRFAVQDDKAHFKQAAAGQRWWRLGPLTDAEVWSAKELVRRVGLEPLRGEIRFGKAGPFRAYAYFAAVGEPSRMTLDDGSWMASEAQLSAAGPPPRKPAVGSALSPQSTWGGARASVAPSRRMTAAQAPASQPRGDPGPALAGVRAVPWQSAQQQQQGNQPPQVEQATSSSFGAPHLARSFLTGTGQPVADPSSGGGRQKPKKDRPARAVDDRLDRLIAQVEELTRSNAAMAVELRALRQENTDLRRQLGAARGVHVHQPYAVAEPVPVLGIQPPLVSEDDVIMTAADADRAAVVGASGPNV